MKDQFAYIAVVLVVLCHVILVFSLFGCSVSHGFCLADRQCAGNGAQDGEREKLSHLKLLLSAKVIQLN